MDGRLRLLVLLHGFGLLLIWIFLLKIQILDHSQYQILAENQHWRALEIPARRGKIVSSDGYVLVDNKTVYLLYGRPKEVDDAKGVGEKLAQILFNEDLYTLGEKKVGLGNLRAKLAGNFVERLGRKELYWVDLYHKISREDKEKIENLGLPGLAFEEEPDRFYPEGDLASYVLGFVGVDEAGKEKGYYGLEGFYDGDLKGEPGRIYEEKTAGGHPILLGGYRQTPSGDGRDLYVSINRSIQYLVEKNLAAGVKKYGAKGGTVTVMDPNSGAILAMASYPNFDPASWKIVAQRVRNLSGNEIEAEVETIASFRNPVIAEIYEPGSVLKALTMSAGIALSIVTPQTTFVDDGVINVGGFRVDNWDGKHHGQQTMIEVLQKSNNMGAAFVARKVGDASLREYFLKFGLGARLGIDLEGEASGLVKKSSEFREIDLVTNAFGQGIAVTPLQLVSAFSAIANGGTLYKPYVLAKIKGAGGEDSFERQPLRQVLTPAKAAVMVEMLTAAAEGGEAKFFVLKKYRVAGKTGTAQIPKGEGYDPNKTNATFIGFLPKSRGFVMLVKISEPSSSIYAAETAVPLWMTITKDLVTYFGIPPDR